MTAIILILVMVALMISANSYRRAAAGGAVAGRPAPRGLLVAIIAALALLGAVLTFYLLSAQ